MTNIRTLGDPGVSWRDPEGGKSARAGRDSHGAPATALASVAASSTDKVRHATCTDNTFKNQRLEGQVLPTETHCLAHHKVSCTWGLHFIGRISPGNQHFIEW